MNWDMVGALSELAGAGAVVVTLYYLAVQLRENRRQTQADNTNRSLDRWLQAQVRMLESEDSVHLMRTALNHYDQLSPEQQGRFTSYMFELHAAYLAVLNLQSKQLIDPREFTGIENAFAAYMTCPGASAWWRDVSVRMPEHVVQNMQKQCSSYRGRPFTELLPFYKPVTPGDQHRESTQVTTNEHFPEVVLREDR